MSMNEQELLQHLINLKACDPDYVVDVLGITSERLVEDYLPEAVEFIKEDMG